MALQGDGVKSPSCWSNANFQPSPKEEEIQHEGMLEWYQKVGYAYFWGGDMSQSGAAGCFWLI
eukprot:888944-Pelagomonas_calceolata.AAC.2